MVVQLSNMKAERDAQTGELQVLMGELSALQLERDELMQNQVSVTEAQSSSHVQVTQLQIQLNQLQTEQVDTESELFRWVGVECGVSVICRLREELARVEWSKTALEVSTQGLSLQEEVSKQRIRDLQAECSKSAAELVEHREKLAASQARHELMLEQMEQHAELKHYYSDLQEEHRKLSQEHESSQSLRQQFEDRVVGFSHMVESATATLTMRAGSAIVSLRTRANSAESECLSLRDQLSQLQQNVGSQEAQLLRDQAELQKHISSVTASEAQLQRMVDFLQQEMSKSSQQLSDAHKEGTEWRNKHLEYVAEAAGQFKARDAVQSSLEDEVHCNIV
jgi:chromosome segregation ATPase